MYPNILGHTGALQVDKRRAAHAFEGKKEAMILEGKIHRKVPHYHPQYAMLVNEQTLQVVKQTVMTVVYGVTWVGGRQQIAVSMNLCSTLTVLKLVNHSFKIGTL